MVPSAASACGIAVLTRLGPFLSTFQTALAGADQWTGHATQGMKARHYRSWVAIEIQAVKGFEALYSPFIDTEKIQYKRGWWNELTMSMITP